MSSKNGGASSRPTSQGPGVERTARYRLGRLLQLVGMMVLPFGIVSELQGAVGLGQSLLIAGGGALVFYVGYVIQNRGG